MYGLEDAALARIISADQQRYIGKWKLDLLNLLKPTDCD
jgi:hypothetical protein